ncbi:hypothetical protein LCGC14_2944250 [marine sediment metagenome]|uniref:Uncharacterized protein n=1 Tax=marine sediment metagenome TaxID=412755 RepID=A0A0F8XHP7_9ZZZZ
MYKDKDRQREANRQAQAKFKAKGITEQGITLPKETDLGNTLTTTQTVSAAMPERTAQGNIRVSKPGDDDYVPQCETTRAFVEDRPKGHRPKRGKDIKCFADLPPDVQRTIDKMSTTDGRLDKEDKAKRTARAIHYQRLFPDSWYSKSPETTVGRTL